jgi:4-amino-4-deoxy-L-arabinose transferase-like glycosyltransferase
LPFFERLRQTPYSIRTAFLLVLLITCYRFIVLVTSDINIYADEAYYWGWAQHFDFGYYSKPPMVAWTIIVTTALFGDSEIAVKIGSLFLYIITAMTMYLLGRELHDEKTGFYTLLAFTTLPAVSLSSMIISTDALFLLFWSLSLLFFIKAIREDKWRWWILLGVTGGFGLLSKYTMILFVVSAFIYLALSVPYRRHLKNARLYAGMVIAALVYSPNLLWNINNHFASFLHTRDNAHLEASLFHFGKLAEFLGGQLAVFGPVMFIVLVTLFYRYKTLARDERFKMLAWFVIPFFTLITVISFLSRAHANWAAPVYIASTVIVVGTLISQGRMKLLKIAIGINIALALVFYHYHAIAHILNIELTRKTDPHKRILGWDRLGEAVGRVLQANPGAKLLGDDRKVMASLIYYVRPHPFNALFWNPDGSILNHYELTTDMNQEIGSDFVYITDKASIDAVAARFDSAEKIEAIHIPIHRDYSLDFYAYRLDGFRGYE